MWAQPVKIVKKLLLVLDNVEQVLAAALLVMDLRRLSGADGSGDQPGAAARGREHEYPVSPLAGPDPRHLPSLASLTQYEAVRLFIERAQAVQPDFQVSNTMAPAVAQICARLDRLPLAIEVAARVKLLPPRALLDWLDQDQRLAVLCGP
jgi:non-specific serine/threonine protein kinase